MHLRLFYFMQTMHFIHAAKYHITDVPGFTKTAWVRLWRRSKLRIWSEYSIRQLKTIEAASYSDYHWVRWRMLPTNLSKAAGGVLYYQFNIGNWLGEYYLDIVLWSRQFWNKSTRVDISQFSLCYEQARVPWYFFGDVTENIVGSTYRWRSSLSTQ